MRAARSGLNRALAHLMPVIGVAVAAIVAADAAPGQDWTAPPTKDFPLAGGNYWHQRYSALDRINTTNVKRLGGAWMIRLEEGRRGGQLEGTPVVVDGVMYVSTGTRNVLAIDPGTGNVKWRYRPDDAQGLGGGNKGVVVA
jgi:glucose dehydrogenase